MHTGCTVISDFAIALFAVKTPYHNRKSGQGQQTASLIAQRKDSAPTSDMQRVSENGYPGDSQRRSAGS